MSEPLDYESRPPDPRRTFLPTRPEALSIGQMVVVIGFIFLIHALTAWPHWMMIVVAVALVLLSSLVPFPVDRFRARRG